jgi:uncharacterized protein YycO
MAYEPRVGDYGVVKTNGFFGKLIRLGTMSRWNHCFIYIGDGKIVEADPKGVKISPVTDYPLIAWNQHEVMSTMERQKVAQAAIALVGKPYSFLTIALLAFRILGVKALSNSRVMEYMAQKEGYICSELVEECYDKAEIVLVPKRDYLVVPGDLAERLVYQ